MILSVSGNINQSTSNARYRSEISGDDETRVDYGVMYQSRYALLRKAYDRFVKDIPQEFWDFCWIEGWWLEDYSLFMALKDANGGAAWTTWEEKYK
mgnify:CR=1 FL=1